MSATLWTFVSASLASAPIQLPEVVFAKQICGIVLDSNSGLPIELAEVSAQSGLVQQQALTDSDGRFCISSESSAQIIIRAAGFNDRAVEGSIEQMLEIALDPDTETGPAIIVRAQHISTPFTERVIKKLEILTDPQARADPLIAVANLAFSTAIDNSADLKFRGSAAGLTRIYYDDIPLYEVVRGSTIDSLTRGASLLNPAIVDEVEVYPTAAPPFLSNHAGGAVRILPEEKVTDGSILFTGLTGATFTGATSLGETATVHAYVGYTNLTPFLEINPNQKPITRDFQSKSAGAVWRFETESGGRVNLFTLADQENGTYPLAILNALGLSQSRRSRVYLGGSLAQPLHNQSIKVDFGYTHSAGQQTFGIERSSRNASYIYTDIDLAGPVNSRSFQYRIGAAYERIAIRGSNNSGLLAELGRSPTESANASYGAVYGFFSYKPAQPVTLSVSTRQTAGKTGPIASYGVNAAWELPDTRGTIVVGTGIYSAIVPSDFLIGVEQAESKQVSIDYKYVSDAIKISVGLFLKRDTLGNQVSHISGADMSLSINLLDWVGLEARYATARVRTGIARGQTDLPYLLRLSTSVDLDDVTKLSLALIQRSGAVYTPVVDSVTEIGGATLPIFASSPNGSRLKHYQTIDANLVSNIKFWPSKVKPIGFITVSNLLNTINQARIAYNPDYSDRFPVLYERRAVTVGLVFQFR